MAEFSDRRRAKRYPVTLSARVHDAGRSYRTEILDVSAGGLLLSPPSGLAVDVDASLQIDATVIGRVHARVVGISHHGIHLRVEPDAFQYASAIRHLSGFSRSW